MSLQNLLERPDNPEVNLIDELINTVTHAIGVGLALAGLAVLLTLASLHGNARQLISYSVYGVTLVLLYAISTAYHGVRLPWAKHWLRFRLQVLSSSYLACLGACRVGLPLLSRC